MTYTEASEILEQAELLFTEAEVQLAIKRIANEMTRELQGSNPLLICCMNGGLVFTGQLLPLLNFPLQIDYLHASRYGDNTNGGELLWRVEPQFELTGRTVVLLDDILDEGVTLAAVAEYCRRNGAAKVMMAALVEKLHLRKVVPGMRADFTGVEVGDRFVIGYGLDCKGYWRNAAGIYGLNKK